MAQLDEFGRHEVLHMSNFLVRAINDELVEHEQVKSRPAWLALAERAAEALATLYQAIGDERDMSPR